MINTNAFDYINVLDKAADAAALRHQVLSNNIANDDTPGYKRQDVAFESELKKALGTASANTNIDKKVGNIKTDQLKPDIYTDMKGYSYRLDGNNVDIDTENVKLAENQIKYQGLLDSITHEFNNLQIVMK
ncbi:MAG TPA: flagellar basal body rod protein FlgB [Lachnospiraceae bacterium]|nr:flagellar basal body rod protein FlgB [Lachnospiraceae bacterium]